MQSSADLRADQATTERAKVLAPFSLTERQARFLATVMLHSGVFVGRQYAAFASITHGQKVHDFIDKAHRHLRGKRVLVQSTGEHLTMKVVQDRVARAARAAKVRPGVHILRHTFCSHLAMRGAPARAIQELAGHQDLKTTQRYMHLSPAAIEGAIRLLDASRTGTAFGNMLATGSTESANVTR